MNKQYKFTQGVQAMDVKASDGRMRFSGYLAYFDNVDSYGDIIVKGAFLDSINEIHKRGRPLPVLEQHGGGFAGSATDNTPIGYYESLHEDENGLWADGVLFSTERGKQMHTILREAPASTMGQSIGYRVVKRRHPTHEERERIKGVEQYLEALELWEGSIVTFPANEKARVDNVKSASMFWRQLEENLRNGGFSKDGAKKAISIIKATAPDCDFTRVFTQCTDDTPQDVQTGASKLLEAIQDIKLQSGAANLKNVISAFKLA